jgi:hypothetical protein
LGPPDLPMPAEAREQTAEDRGVHRVLHRGLQLRPSDTRHVVHARPQQRM